MAGMNDDDDPLAQLIEQQKIIKDRVRGVAYGVATGLYLYGRPGTAKRYTVRETLDRLQTPYEYLNGYLTPAALFNVIEANSAKTIVLDDVSSVFCQPIAMQILLAALGRGRGGERIVSYETFKGRREARFRGGIIAISNLPLAGHQRETLTALKDRVNVIHYDPTDEQMAALILDIASKGVGTVEPPKALMVARYLLQECKKRGIRPSVRLFVDKAIKDYELWSTGRCETDWRDLVVSNLQQQLIDLQHETRDVSRQEAKESEQRIAGEIFASVEDRTARAVEWKSRTGKSEKSFYRRVKELKAAGVLS